MNLIGTVKVGIANVVNALLSRYPYKILNTEDSLKYIIKEKCSVSRFGEGEIRMMKAGVDIGFQKTDAELVRRLKEIIKGKGKCKIAIPYTLVDYSHMNDYGRSFWKTHLSYGHLMYWRLINKHIWYLDTQISRFYLDIEDKTKSKKYIDLWKKIWNNRNVVFVEGDKTRLGYANDFFLNAKSIRRIECPAENAWEHYSEILNVCKEIDKSFLILIALGPSASVLAYDLAELGYQAIDIGHLDIEYEWYLMRAQSAVAIKNKYTNEAKNGSCVDSIDDKKFQEQIITRIKE